MSIFVCGDIHSTLDINKLDGFIGREDLNENDYLIICGDTGICGFSKEQEAATRAYLRGLPMTVLFADGNHEQFDALNSYSVDEWNGGKVHIIEPGIIHLMRDKFTRLMGRASLYLVVRIPLTERIGIWDLPGLRRNFLQKKNTRKLGKILRQMITKLTILFRIPVLMK